MALMVLRSVLTSLGLEAPRCRGSATTTARFSVSDLVLATFTGEIPLRSRDRAVAFGYNVMDGLGVILSILSNKCLFCA